MEVGGGFTVGSAMSMSMARGAGGDGGVGIWGHRTPNLRPARPISRSERRPQPSPAVLPVAFYPEFWL